METNVIDKLKVPKTMQPLFDTVSGLIDQFCRTHLNEEYSLVSRGLAAALCRKRPSPLAKGKPEQWACACVYAIGSANFLYDKSQTPHMTSDKLCELFGLCKSTTTTKARSINQLMGIGTLDPRRTLSIQVEQGFALHICRKCAMRRVCHEAGIYSIPDYRTPFSNDTICRHALS